MAGDDKSLQASLKVTKALQADIKAAIDSVKKAKAALKKAQGALKDEAD